MGQTDSGRDRGGAAPPPGPTARQVGLALALVLLALGVNFAVPRLAEVAPFLTLYLALSLVALLVPFPRVLWPLVLGSAGIANWGFFHVEHQLSLDWPSVVATLGFVVIQIGLGTLIIERTRLVERLERRNDELATAAAFETRLRDMVSHDIRNPLGSIRLGIEVLLRRRPVAADRDVLERMERSAIRIQKLAQALLDVARLRTGQPLPLDPRPVDLVPLVRQMAEELPGADRVQLLLPERLDGSWDPDRLGQVISNLVGNGLQHSPEGSPVRVTLVATADEAHLEVHNLGPPIDPALVPLLFVPFGHLRASPGRKESVGLGLFIARSVAEAHGGRVELASSSERGTTFVLHLPLGSSRGSARSAPDVGHG